MFDNKTFAVVDLETTGTKRKDNDRIIQFGCALIKHGKITKTYSFLINPEKDLLPVIENLTGIKNEDLKHQPTFKHFAKQINQILKNTIFVAHNVNFDLPFLNSELVEAGIEPLTNRSIDTVELAQITFPTFASFKLQDLTEKLNIKHTNPHQADSDAVVTAKLLLIMFEQLRELPQATLHTLSALSKGLTRNTDYIFEEIAAFNRQTKRPLPSDMTQIKGIVLKKQKHDFSVEEPQITQFPLNDSEKKDLFNGKIIYRKNQVNLMNRIHNFVQGKNGKSLLVEAPNGTGKTLSYLFSYAYELSNLQKLVIATPTKVLQQQIISQEIPQLLKITGLNLHAELVKSSSHYLDLDGFFHSLYTFNQNKPTTILQMRILVWLTKTTTGDLDELQLTAYNTPIFSIISHPGDARVGSDFSDFDFWNFARYKQEQADILVTNHAFLANHYHDLIWGQNPYLVVDEAHRFVDNVTNSRADTLQFESFWGMLAHLEHLIFSSKSGFSDVYANDQNLIFLLDLLEPKIQNLIYSINDFQKFLFGQIQNTNFFVNRKRNTLTYSLTGDQLFKHQADASAFLQKLQDDIDSVRQSTNRVIDWLYQQKDSLLASDISLIDEISAQIDRLDYYSEQAYLLADQINKTQSLADKGFVLTIGQNNDPLSINISWLMLDSSTELKNLYQRFTKKMFISATLTDDKQSFAFITSEFALEEDEVETYLAKSTFDYQRHLKVYSLKDPSFPTDPNSANYNKALNYLLPGVLANRDHSLVLFTNLETIKTVYDHVAHAPALSDFEVLAQGITGSNEKIAKRFTLAKKSILLGANTFWEGIDFKDTTVDLVVVTKLPFESPDNPEVQLRQQKLQQAGMDAFASDTLPRAVIRFRQACGRLIRNENDSGEFLTIDPRFNQSTYSDIFQASLPLKNPKFLSKDELIETFNKQK